MTTCLSINRVTYPVWR